MTNQTATSAAIEQARVEAGLGHPPQGIETEEDYLKWALAEIQKKARRDAEPFMKRLMQLESRKPLKPIFIPLDQWPEHLIKPLRET
ncbi:hypothetical protein OEG84_11395 [Hoeflea sp. G2-23]|uniref:Uncharacterized protein n=1 Tax=Hoeflea algicola TaxID=2983763 RepID=A0ABT3Z936_9HYPH|nr:hypothetical protein [Hoeflea algicola]MCY0148297.1 hypothetical protein [Hoeflea algicola]